MHVKSELNGCYVQSRLEPLQRCADALKQAIENDYSRATAMPGAYYVDEDLLKLELRHVFGGDWICIGRADEIPAPGNFMAYDLLGEPVAIIRGSDEVIRALSNVCRHRGVPILSGIGSTRRIVCPYHAWTYDLSGELIGAPEMNEREAFDRTNCNLPELPCEIWQGFIFISLNPEVEPLKPRLADLDARIANYHFEEMHTRYVSWETWDTNWKSLMENFMEGYHLTPLHRETLHPVNPTRLCKHFPAGERYFGYTAGFDPSMPRLRRGHSDLSRQELDTCVMFAVPPNLLVGGASDYSSFVCVEPLSTGSVRVRLGLFFHGNGWSEDDLDRAIMLFQETMEEDKMVLSKINRGLSSQFYQPGPLASEDFEGGVVDLARYIGKQLKDVLPPAS